MAMMTDIRPANVRAAADEFPATLIGNRTKEDIVAQIQSLKPPEFIHPYPSRHNPNESKAVANSLAWFHEQSLETVFIDPRRVDLFVRSRIHDLPPLINVDAEVEELSWLCCYMLWGFLFDDVMEQRGYFRSLEKSALIVVELNLVTMYSFPDNPLLHNTFVELINLLPDDRRQGILESVDAKLAKARQAVGSVYDTSDSGALVASFNDLWVKLLASTPPDSAIRWANSKQKFFLGNVIEAVNRNREDVPSVKEYIGLRQITVGVDPSILLAEYADKLNTSLPWELFDSAEMTAFRLAIIDIVAWHNDIYSFKKETLNGDYHNLVWVISHDRGCSLSDAQKLALEMLHNRLQEFERAIADLEAISTPDTQRGVSAFVKTARYWVVGYHDFTLKTERYSWKESAADDVK